jgi:two-component system, chemotaxis family, sensor kinase CheA
MLPSEAPRSISSKASTADAPSRASKLPMKPRVSIRPSMIPPRQRTTLLRKFMLTMLVVSSIIGATTLVVVLFLSARSSEKHLREIETNIEQSITSKGKILTENHALALRGMVLDNAFLDMQSLLTRAVNEDSDLVYGLFTNQSGETLAFRLRGAQEVEGAPLAKDAWKTLGFKLEDLSVPEKALRRAERLGHEVVEVSVPIFGEEHEQLGTLRYGLSTRRMHQALGAATLDSKAQKVRSIQLIGLAVTLATLMGILLSRMQAVRITRPVQDLTRAASDLADGDRDVRVKIQSGDELEMLGFSFNRMVWELTSSYEKLEDMNRTLEERVRDRTLALAGRNEDMRAVLDNVDQGLITLTPDGVMASERSAVVDQWFGKPSGPQTLWGYLAETSPDFAHGFRLGWDQLVEDFLPLELSIDQLPKRLKGEHATYDFRYLPLLRDERLHSVLVVVADVTSRLLHERDEAESAELMQAFRRLMKDRAGFMAFQRDASGLLKTISAPDCEPSVLRMALHTLKGNAALMGLSVVAKLCHQLEDELASEDSMSPTTLGELQSRWQGLCEHVAQLGPSDARLVEVPDTEYAALVAMLQRAGQSEAVERVLSWKLESATRSLERLSEQARALAARLGKGPLEVEVRPTTARIDPEYFGPVFSDLVHVMRNAVDHGIESSEEREAAGKPAAGRITFAAVQKSDGVVLEIADDGRGIDWDVIRKKAANLGLPAQSHADLVAALCHEGFSTRTEVTETSGRGVGMAAVKRRIEAIKGRLEVQSTLGKGATWTFVIPLPKSAMPLRRAQVGAA